MPSARYLPALLTTLTIAAFGAAPLAHADGDPASDYLLMQSTFLSPFDGHSSTIEDGRLVQMLTQAHKKGFSLKVAVIVTAYDLGSVPILFRKPKTYAKFLGEEDRYVWTDELLVVMPNGYGISKARGLPAADQATIDSLKPPNTTNGTALVVAAENAVRALAARHGITLDVVPGQPSNSTFDQQRIEIAAAILLAGLIAVAIRLGSRRRMRR